MSEISAGGKKFKKGEIVEYTTLAGKSTQYKVVRKSGDNPPGLILADPNNENKQFAINAASVATRIKKTAQPSPDPVSPPQEEMPPQDSEPAGSSPAQNSPQNYPPYAPPGNYAPQGRLSRFWDKIKPIGNKIKSNLPPLPRFAYEFLIFLAIAVHLADAFWLNFSISPAAIGYRITLYFVFGIFVHLILNRGWGLYESILEIFKVSAIPLILVPLISVLLNLMTVSAEVVTFISTLTLAFPIWLFYIMYMRDEKIHLEGGFWNKVVNLLFTPSGWARIWFAVLLIFMLFNFVTFLGTAIGGNPGGTIGGIPIPGYSGIPGAEDSGFDATVSMEGLTKFMANSFERMTTSVGAFIKGVRTGFVDLKNQSLGEYYTGQVEQNKEQTGVFITDFHVTGKQYDTVPVVAYGYIKARSFVDDITITPSCYAQSVTNRSKVYQGTVDPPVLENIYIEDQRGVICSFENYGTLGSSTGSGSLPADRYQVFLVLDFNFETWAYKQYYFVDRSYLIYLKTNGINPITKLQIPQKTKTIYTNGPVMIGMDDAVEMPFAISSESTNYLPIGMTIDDKPQLYGVKGQVVKVYEYTLRLPEAFTINTGKRSCTVDSRWISNEADPNVTGYRIYKFSIDANTPNLNLTESYMTLNCNVEIPGASVQSVLSGANDYSIVSVVGTVRYDYRFTKQIPVTVEKTPGT